MSRIASIRFSDLLPLAWSSLRRNRLRSFLTIGAIAVGIAVMVYLVSLGYGLEQLTLGSVQNSPALLTISVTTPNGDLLPLNTTAAQKIKKISGIKQVMPLLQLKGEMALDQHYPTTLLGVDTEYLQTLNNAPLEVGNYYRDDDTASAVVSTGFLKAFGLEQSKTPSVLFTMQISPDKGPVIGPISDIAITGVVTEDSAVAYLPRAYLESLITAAALPAYQEIKVGVNDLNSIESVQNSLIADGFKTSAAVDSVDQVNQVFTWIRAIMSGLGLIAIFVATIGMFNTLTISLLERTREIGIMKALGVRNRDISRLFMLEAALIGILGGIAGLVIAIALQQVTLFALSLLADISNSTSPQVFNNQLFIIIGALVLALVIALITGLYPARRATHLNPIDAIRHE